MKYLIVQDWESTHGNHAGMVHMCNLLSEKYPDDYKVYIKPCGRPKLPSLISRIDKIIGRKLSNWVFAKEYRQLCSPMFKELKPNDEVFLLEYHVPDYSQYELAKLIKRNYPFVRVYGLSHLTPSWFINNKYEDMAKKWSHYIDVQLTLGSSLSHYFESIGIPSSKISTGIHYVDSDYYKGSERETNLPITIIAIGAIQRNYQLLADIVNTISNVKWIICKGKKRVESLFNESKNIELIGYVEESVLKQLMSKADLSLNVLDDTVGSNVITTSMSMGLGIITSDVGSIHDYCGDDNALFCSNTQSSFVDAIKSIVSNPEIVLSMKMASLKRSCSFDIKKINEWFSSLNTI